MSLGEILLVYVASTAFVAIGAALFLWLTHFVSGS
jgi:hypothetical protein